MPDRAPTPEAFVRFYAPLAATGLLLTATNPLLAAALARTDDPVTALAGYAVAFALCGVLYSPLLVVQQVTATRILEGCSVAPVRRFALVTGSLLSVAVALAGLTEPGTWVLSTLVGVRGEVLAEAQRALLALIPVPLLTGYRSFHQGRLVAGHRTHPIAVATGFRTGSLAVAAFGLAALASGAWIGGAAFTLGLAVEALVVAAAPTHPVSRPTPRPASDGDEGGDEILKFSTPLMLNVVFWWSTPLLINAILARVPNPETALAAFAVVEAVAWFVTSPVGQLQHVGIALVHDRESFRKVRLWSGMLSVGVFLILGVLVLPGTRTWALRLGFSLDPTLLDAAGRALPLAVLYPFFYGHRQFFQGLFVRAGCPGVVGWGAVLRVVTVVLLGAFLIGPFGRLGASLGVGLQMVGLGVEGLFLERLSDARVPSTSADS